MVVRRTLWGGETAGPAVACSQVSELIQTPFKSTMKIHHQVKCPIVHRRGLGHLRTIPNLKELLHLLK